MNKVQSEGATNNFESKMFLYEKPELLTKVDHGNLGLSRVERPYDYVRSAKVVPIAVSEIASAQKYYPVIFSDIDKPILLAVVSVLDDINLFIEEDGTWDSSAYIPTYLHCHPFAFASFPDDQFAVVIDRAAAAVSESPELPFFDGEDLTPQIQARIDLCSQFSAQREKTSLFCNKVKELGLFSGQRAAHTPPDGDKEEEVASYIAVNIDKLRDLDKETLQELHKDGSLSAIYAHIFSLENWFLLMERRRRRGLPIFKSKQHA
jgi:hypothetical protein